MGTQTGVSGGGAGLGVCGLRCAASRVREGMMGTLGQGGASQEPAPNLHATCLPAALRSPGPRQPRQAGAAAKPGDSSRLPPTHTQLTGLRDSRFLAPPWLWSLPCGSPASSSPCSQGAGLTAHGAAEARPSPPTRCPHSHSGPGSCTGFTDLVSASHSGAIGPMTGFAQAHPPLCHSARKG